MTKETIYTEPCAIDPDGSHPFCIMCGESISPDMCRGSGLCVSCLVIDERKWKIKYREEGQ